SGNRKYSRSMARRQGHARQRRRQGPRHAARRAAIARAHRVCQEACQEKEEIIEDVPMLRSFLLAAGVLALITLPAHARPAYKQALAQYFGAHLPKNLNACTTCHLPDAPDKKPGDELDKPPNAFGLRL